MSDLNKWIGSGRLAKDLNLRYTPNGTAVGDFTLCSNRVWSSNGEKKEETLFIDVTIWGKVAETLSQYLKKGTYVLVEGRLKLDSWEDKEGSVRRKINVVADQVNLVPLASKATANANAGTPF